MTTNASKSMSGAEDEMGYTLRPRRRKRRIARF
jgi:hypothetical protein